MPQGQPARASFNGATAMKPWKSMPPCKKLRVIMLLQWGHGDEAVEEGNPDFEQHVFFVASMGPRR